MNLCQNARIAINHVLFQCSNIRLITRKGSVHAAFDIVFKHLPRDPSNGETLKTKVDPYSVKCLRLSMLL